MDNDPFGICVDENKELKLPSLAHMAKEAVQTAAGIVGGVLSGDDVLASEEVSSARRLVCNGCEFFIHKDNRCSKCGCHMTAKTTIKSAKCPLDKWKE